MFWILLDMLLVVLDKVFQVLMATRIVPIHIDTEE